MSPSEESTHGAASIPTRKPTKENTATTKSQSRKLYRSSLPAYVSPQSSTKEKPHLSRSHSNPSLSTEFENKADKQKDQDRSGDESSSDSSSHEKEDNDDMLSVRDLSSSSTSSLGIPTGDVPALPVKSALRTSRLLASIPQKKAPNDNQPMLPHAAPHQVYLSSEEDASSSADDFSDFDDEMESDGEGSQKPCIRIIPREDTARVVAVVFHGKPSIVTLSPRRLMSPSLSDVGQTGAGLLRTTTEPSLQHHRPQSVASTSSLLTLNHPPRSSSILAGFEKKRPHFLQIDPYAKVRDDQTEHVKGPITPTSMFRRTLSLVKKRSKQNLHHSESQLTPMEKVGEVEEEENPRESVCLEATTPGPVNYQDIMMKAKRHASISSPRSETSSPVSPKYRFRSGLSLGRQRSVRT
ncbi:hypothetical protein ED733_002303 [Metarhizium rileyi]|uniref:Uncharacterized protein n=1 Tax=Metarhizium rileyi (strain RCEF 4871) TaxID=1649241 RepID=A0A5C6G8A7_METRR|nr:hypothetical protein ED733_002303 [Metarhizium rileyi]